jgi:hypothetical protein
LHEFENNILQRIGTPLPPFKICFKDKLNNFIPFVGLIEVEITANNCVFSFHEADKESSVHSVVSTLSSEGLLYLLYSY